MVVTTPAIDPTQVTTQVTTPVVTLDNWIQSPVDDTEWVNGELFEKNDMTAKHSRTQARLSYAWRNHMLSNDLGGEVYTEAPCRTLDRGRRPDVAYLTPELLDRFGDFTVLPQSFPLSAEIISPTDYAEDAISKALEYLKSAGEEVWLVFPENRWIIVATEEHRQIFVSGEVAKTQKVLPDFQINVDELLG